MGVLRTIWSYITRAYAFLNSLPSWLSGAAVAVFVAIGGSMLAWNYFMHTWPIDRVMDGVQWLLVERMSPETYNIMVANLENDTENSQTRHVHHALETGFQALQAESPLRAQRAMRELSLGWSQGATALADAEREGQTWLANFNGDVLIWGAVAEKGAHRLRLRFLSRNGSQQKTAKGYLVGNETFELDPSFGADLTEIVVAQAVAAASPTHGTASYIADVLKPQVKRLENILKTPSPSFTPAHLAELREMLAFNYSILGDQTADRAALERSVKEFRTVADYWREKNQERWAITQDRLGNALMRMGQRVNDIGLLDQAMEAFNQALTVLTPQSNLHRWAITKNDLANALLAVGERESGTERLEEALATYHEALGAIDPETSLDWAMVQNNYGSALASIGYREMGTEHLNQALQAYETAQVAQPRNTVPLAWAHTATNMGTALAVIADRLQSKEDAIRAVAILEDAVSVLKPNEAASQWGLTQHTLGFALVVQGEIENDKDPIEKAVAAFRQALETRTRANSPIQWALTQSTLGEALIALSRYEEGPARIFEAINALEQALKVRKKETLPLAWAETHRLLAEGHLLLAKRTRRCSDVGRGKASGQAALTVLEGMAGINRERARTALDQLDLLWVELACPQV